MAVKQTKPNFVYGIGDNLLQLPPQPIVANRAPTTSDQAQLGTIWVDTSAGVFYGLASIASGSSTWTSTPAAGATSLASLDITGAGTSLDVQSAAGTTVISSATINFDNAAGLTTISGDLTVSGVTTLSGDLDLSSAALIDLTSTLDADPSIYLHANGGTSEVIRLRADQGTAVDSVDLVSDVGGITLTAGLASDDAINLNAASGGVDIDGALQVNIASSQAAADAIVIDSSNAAGGMDLSCGTAGMDLLATGGDVNVTSTNDAADAIYLHANGGTSETIRLHSDQGTGAASIHLESDAGGITLTSTGLASDDGINLNSVAGGVDVDAALQLNLASSEAAADAVVVSASDAAGGIQLNSSGDIADSIYLHADAGTSETVRLHSDQGTGVASVHLESDVGGITLTATGLASDDAINLSAAAGGVDVDAALQLNLASSEAAADAVVVSASDAAGGIQLNSSGDIADSIYLHADAGTSEKIRVHADQGTAVDSVSLVSDVGGLTLSSGLASDDAINLSASAGGVDVDAALQLNLASSEAAADAVVVSASDAAGGIQLNSTGDIAESIYLHANAGTSETIKIHADQGTALSSIDLVSDAGGARVTTAALGATTGLHLAQGAATVAVQVGAGAPSHNSPKGSLYLRTDGSGTTNRAYIATDAVGTWTAITTSA